jgi:hypothetical protein
MSRISTIIKNLMLPLLIKSAKLDISSAPDIFWEQFAIDFVSFETDASSIYSTLYKLELNNPETIFNQLPKVYSNFIKEVAEEYVLRNENEFTDLLMESKNDTFLKEVVFFKTLKSVITKLERQQLKKNLPHTHGRLVFELDEITLEAVAKKKSREDLKAKFNQWDEELAETEKPLAGVKFSLAEDKESVMRTNPTNVILREVESINYSTKSKRKVISLSWIKYAAVACIILTAGIMYFNFITNNSFVQPDDNNVVTTPNKKSPTSKSAITPEIPVEALAKVTTFTKNASVFESGFGFASKKNNIKIVENNQKARIVTIEKAITKYRQLLENEFEGNKVSYGSKIKVLESRTSSLKKEMVLLKEREKQYVFDGKILILYVSTAAKEYTILIHEDTYYLKKDHDYFKLTVAEQPQYFKKEFNSNITEMLNSIILE